MKLPLVKPVHIRRLKQLIAILGILVSAYALQHHFRLKYFGEVDSVCNLSSFFSCDKVAQSKFSEIFGTPVALLGILFFIGHLIVLCLKPSDRTTKLSQGYDIVGILVSIWLFGLSAIFIGGLCPSCILVYILCTSQFLLRLLDPAFRWRTIYNPGQFAAVFPLLPAAVLASFSFQAAIPFLVQSYTRFAVQGSSDTQEQIKRLQWRRGSKELLSNDNLINDPYLGNKEAKVTLIEFVDYQCPNCKASTKLILKLLGLFPKDLRIVFKNLPIDSKCNDMVPEPYHPVACLAAAYALCAHRMNKFEAYYDKVFRSSEDLVDEAVLKKWMREIDLDKDLEECYQSKEVRAQISNDIKIAKQLGIHGTPAILVNGAFVTGPKSLKSYVDLINAILSTDK